jgi:hypothetical protein
VQSYATSTLDAAITALVGFAGIIAGGLLQMRRGRIEQLRERQLVAADDFATAATAVFVQLTQKMEALGRPDPANPAPWLEGFKRAVDESKDILHELTHRLPRLELLFGAGSPTASAGMNVSRHLHAMMKELNKHPGDQAVVVAEFEAAADSFGEFNKAANNVMTRGGWRQAISR